MENRKRNIQMKFYVTEEEKRLIDEKMKQLPIKQYGAYFRKMAIDGYILVVDRSDTKAYIRELQTFGPPSSGAQSELQVECTALYLRFQQSPCEFDQAIEVAVGCRCADARVECGNPGERVLLHEFPHGSLFFKGGLALGKRAAALREVEQLDAQVVFVLVVLILYAQPCFP